MRQRLLIVLVVLLALLGCTRRSVTVRGLLGAERIEATYLLPDGRWVPADSLRWSDRSWYRQLCFDTDGDGEWNYLYCEVHDDVAGWVWIPSTTRVNPDEEPELARRKKHLISSPQNPPSEPSVDDFGYKRQ